MPTDSLALCVVQVRSPLDAIDSYWHFVLTQTHTDSVRDSEYSRLAAEWKEHVAREAAVWAAFHRHWLAAKVPLLAIRYEDLLDPARRAETLQLVATFLYARAGPAESATPEAAAAALRGMLARVQAAARECAAAAAADAADAAGASVHEEPRVYRPRRGEVGGGLSRFSDAQRLDLAETLGAELCLFKYDADPASDGFGRPLDGPPHAIYLDPSAVAQPAAAAVAAAAAADGAPLPTAAPPPRPKSVLLNRGKPLRPSGDARGWKWREQLLIKRDASLVFASESQVAHVEAKRG